MLANKASGGVQARCTGNSVGCTEEVILNRADSLLKSLFGYNLKNFKGQSVRLRSILTNSFGILLSRITGLVRDILMASALGASVWSDIFFVAFKLPNLFRRIFAEGAFVQAFMPSFVSSKHKGVFAVAIFLRFFAFLFAFSLIVTLFPEPITKAIAWGWDENRIELAAPLTAINFWYLDLIFIVTFLATLLQYKEHFATTALSTALLNLSMIAALWITLKSDPKTVAYALSIAVVVGGLLQVIVHLLAIYKKRMHKVLLGGIKYRKKKEVGAEVDEFKKLFVPGIVGNAAPQLSSFLDTLLATFLVAGSVSYLFYANRIFQLPLALFAIATATALFPSISKALANDKKEQAYANFTKAFWLLLFLLGIATLGGILFAEPIIWLLFERGRFDASDRIVTADVLSMYMIGLIPYGLAKLFSLYLYATKAHKKAAKITIISLVTTFLFSLILMKPFGASGLALAGSIGGWVLFALTLKEAKEAAKRALAKPKLWILWLLTMMIAAALFAFVAARIATLLWRS